MSKKYHIETAFSGTIDKPNWLDVNDLEYDTIKEAEQSGYYHSNPNSFEMLMGLIPPAQRIVDRDHNTVREIIFSAQPCDTK
jgi:hypothetical protein